ncbi:MAG: hypothetical protein OXN97_09410 [Bryobacterales bacterium]|nr:hypothetical protein [Bryobacterales bacterium]MDE0624833.1 hypothetical protein [Bryobacterales bacterium]
MKICSDHRVSARAIRNAGDIQAFVRCAHEFMLKAGPDVARAAFHEEGLWRHGPYYVFVDEIASGGDESRAFVYPPDPSREGRVWGRLVDSIGTDVIAEMSRTLAVVDEGWGYYGFRHPATGEDEAKASYFIKTEWKGNPAAIGAGIYARDMRGTCATDDVTAAELDSAPSQDSLRAFVECAAELVAAKGYFAMDELQTSSRWSHGSTYVFVLDMTGHQVLSSSGVRVSGRSIHEWGGADNLVTNFGGRDLLEVANTFGEAFLYYSAYNPTNFAVQGKVSMLKRVVAHGVPVLVGAGYYLPPGGTSARHSVRCADNNISASAIRNSRDIEAFVNCAYELVMRTGPDAARRAFHEDDRWSEGPFYVSVSGIAPTGDGSMSFVYPPDPSLVGSYWGPLADRFGTDLLAEVYRIMELVDEGWVYYSFRNPATGREEPKSTYARVLDWEGHRAVIGAGIYSRDLPGTCRASEVNAAMLEEDPSDARLREFVRCAAIQAESSGFFAGPVLSSGPRWLDGSTYVFGVDPVSGAVEFSGSPSSFAVSGRIPEVLFGGRNVLKAAMPFGNSYWYYNFADPATGEAEAKISFVVRILINGKPLLVGSGYDPHR